VRRIHRQASNFRGARTASNLRRDWVHLSSGRPFSDQICDERVTERLLAVKAALAPVCGGLSLRSGEEAP
jgi:hypothetical protein